MPRRRLLEKKKLDRNDQPALIAGLFPCTAAGPTVDELTDRLKNLLVFEEGRVVLRNGLHVAYRDSKGIYTIGYGFNLQDASAPEVLARVTTTTTAALIAKTAYLTEEEAQALLLIAEQVALRGVRHYFPDLEAIELPRQVVLSAMVYQFGESRFGKFRRLIPAVKERQWPVVATSMEESQWYRHDSPLRARRMVAAMRTATFPASAIQSPGGPPSAPLSSDPGSAGGDAATAPRPPRTGPPPRSPWPFDNT